MQTKKLYTILGITVIVFLSFAMLVYAAAWTPDDMAVYMQNIGRHKIYQTNWILYNQIGPKVNNIHEIIDNEMAHETLDIQVQTILQDTYFGIGTNPHFKDTQIGGSDKVSYAYVHAIFRGQPVYPYFLATVLDGDRYEWFNVTSFFPALLFGDVEISAPSGVAPGSYLVRVDAYYEYNERTFYGTATYTIECSSTTT